MLILLEVHENLLLKLVPMLFLFYTNSPSELFVIHVHPDNFFLRQESNLLFPISCHTIYETLHLLRKNPFHIFPNFILLDFPKFSQI